MKNAKIKVYTGPTLNAVDVESKGATLITYPGYTLYPPQRIELAESYADRVEGGESLIVLTQDDIIIRSVMLVVADGKLTPDEVEITYVDWSGDNIVQKECKLAEDGRLEHAFPSGMFDESYNLLCEMMRLAGRKEKRGGKR